MKHELTITLSFLFLATDILTAQDSKNYDASLTDAAIQLSVGGGSAASQWFQDLYDYGQSSADPKADLGGFAVSFAVLKSLNDRIQLGGEVGIFVIGPGSLRGLSYGPYTCYGSGCGGSPTDDTGIHFGPLAALRLFTVGRLVFRLEGGGGLNFFNLNDAGPAQSKNRSVEFVEGSPYYSSKPGAEPYLAGRIAPAIMLLRNGGSGISINPYVSVLKTFGMTDTKSVTFGGSLGIFIGGK